MRRLVQLIAVLRKMTGLWPRHLVSELVCTLRIVRSEKEDLADSHMEVVLAFLQPENRDIGLEIASTDAGPVVLQSADYTAAGGEDAWDKHCRLVWEWDFH